MFGTGRKIREATATWEGVAEGWRQLVVDMRGRLLVTEATLHMSQGRVRELRALVAQYRGLWLDECARAERAEADVRAVVACCGGEVRPYGVVVIPVPRRRRWWRW